MNDKLMMFHIDLKHSMWTCDYLELWAKRLAKMGYNAILLEIEDKYLFKNHPVIAKADAMSSETLAETVEMFNANGLTVVPLVQSLGHAEYVCMHEEYAYLRENGEHLEQYDPDSDEVRAFLFELFDEMIEKTKPEAYFHMGGDETWSLGKSEKYRKIVEEKGIGWLYLQHMLPLFEHIKNKGLRPVIWADIVLTHPEIIDDIPDYVVLMDWEYTTDTPRPEQIRIWGSKAMFDWNSYQTAEDPTLQAFKERFDPYCVDEQSQDDHCFNGFFYTDALLDMGFDVITAPATRCYGDNLAVPQIYHIANTYHFARKGLEKCLGSCVTCWTVRYNHPECNLPAAYAATYAMDHSSFSLADFFRKYTSVIYGCDFTEFAIVMQHLETPIPFAESHQLFKVFGLMEADEFKPEELYFYMMTDDKRVGLTITFDGNAQTIEQWLELFGKWRNQLQLTKPLIIAMANRVQNNHDNLSYWTNALKLMTFYVEFHLAALTGTMAEKQNYLRSRLNECREDTETLFARTFTKEAVAEEVRVRFSFHESCLERAEQMSKLYAAIKG